MKKKALSLILVLCMVLGFVPAGLFVSTAAPTEQITVALDPDSTYGPTTIINGDFSTVPFMSYKYNGTVYTSYPGGGSTGSWITESYPNGTDGGWNTTETRIYSNSLFEYSNSAGTYGLSGANGYFIEMNAFVNATVYQDLTTVGGDVMLWTLNHGFRSGWGEQKMRVIVGAPEENETPTNTDPKIIAESKGEYTSTGVSGDYAYAGELANLDLASNSAGKWYSCSGVYVVPEGQTVTRFAFEADLPTNGGGNCLDDITFSTLIGNLSGTGNSDGSVTVRGYWGDSDSSKKLCIKIGETVHELDMQAVLNNNFAITIPASVIGGEAIVEVYHQDYESAKRSITIAPSVYLNDSEGVNNTVRSFTYPEAVVNGYVKSIIITVDSGSFTVDGYTPFVKDLTGLSQTYIVSGAAEAQAILRAARFTLADGKSSQDVKVSVSGETTDLKNVNITITQNNDADGVPHYYGFVTTGTSNDYNVSGCIAFSDAYAQAKTLVFNGLKGYLATITSAEENTILNNLTLWKGWGGGGRVSAEDAALDGDTFTKDSALISPSASNVWYWVCGPEAGQALSYTYWAEGEPNGGSAASGEYLLMLHHEKGYKWNDVANAMHKLPGYFVEWSEDTRDENAENRYAEDNDTLNVHTHCDCGCTVCTRSGHSCTQEWTAWTSDSELPEDAGYYYLTKDVTFSGEWTAANGVHLCLNGHTAHADGSEETLACDSESYAVTDCSGLIVLGEQTWVSDKVYSVPATIFGDIRTLSIVVTNAKLKLTEVTGTGFKFQSAVVDSKTSHTTPNTSAEYVSVQLIADSSDAAERALCTLRYTNLSEDARVDVSGTARVLKSGDYYLNGHYYTLSSSGSMSWEQAMEWAFNLQYTDPERYSGYKSYPVVITTNEENQMLVNIWYNNGGTRRQIFLPAVPVNPVEGTGIEVITGEDGTVDVVVTGEPKCSDVYKATGHGEVWKWMDGTPEAGQTLPNESAKSVSEYQFWDKDNPTDGGMVYFGHPSTGAYWDDLEVKKNPSAASGQWGTNVWSAQITSSTFKGHMYALAEWEPIADDDITVRASKNLYEHVHSWEYSLDRTETANDTLRAECTVKEGCKLSVVAETPEIVISATNMTYTGQKYTNASLTVTDWTENGISVPEIYYEGTGDTSYASSTEAPVNAGTYIAKITAGDKTAYASFIISPASSRCSVVAAENLVYNSQVQQLITDSSANGGKLVYSVEMTSPSQKLISDWSEEIPAATDAGIYKIKYMVVGDENHADTSVYEIYVTVAKAPSEIISASATAIVYGRRLGSSSISGTVKAFGSVISGTFSWADGTEFPAVSDSDTTFYKIIFTPDDTANIEGCSGEITLTVYRDESSVTAEVTPVNRTYDATSKALANAGSCEGGTLVYAIGTDSTSAPADGWSTVIPEGTDAGTYYVWYKVAGDANHNDTAPVCVTAGIARRDVSDFDIGKFAPLTYNGQAQQPEATVTRGSLTATGSWSKVTNVSDSTVFTATGNYIGTLTADAGMNRKDIVVKANARTKVYGKTDPTLTVTVTGKADSTRIFYTVNRIAGETVGTYAITVTGKSVQGNYNVSYEGSVFTITKATPTITAYAEGIVYGTKLSGSAIKGIALWNGKKVAGTFAWKDGSILPEVSDSGKTAYTVIFTPDDTTDYNTVTTSVKITVTAGKQEVPLTLGKTDESIKNRNDGTVFGLVDNMEYRIGNGQWTAIPAGTEELTGLADGNYSFRVKADANRKQSEVLTLTVAEGRELTVKIPAEAEQIGYTATASCTSCGWMDAVSFTYKLHEGYSETLEYTVSLNGNPVSLDAEGSCTVYATEDLVLSVDGVLDITAPTGVITLGEKNWKQFIESAGFELFFREAQTVTVSAADNGSGIDTVKVFRADKLYTADELARINGWLDYTGDIEVAVADGEKFIYYAEFTDKAGNVTYLCTEGAEFDITAPAIKGIEDNGTYYTTKKVTVSDKNLIISSVNVTAVSPAAMLSPNAPAAAEEGTEKTLELAGNVAKFYTVSAKDKAGNTTVYTVTMKPISSIEEPVKDITKDNVKETDKQKLIDVKKEAESVDTTDATPEEKEALENIKKKCEELLEEIETLHNRSFNPVITEGSGAIADLSIKGITLSFVSDGIGEEFEALLIDGKVVDPADYTFDKEGVKVTLNNSHLEAMADGTHTLSMKFTNGTASCPFGIEKPAEEENPETGVGGLAGWVLAMFAIPAAAAAAYVKLRKKEED